MKKLAMTVLMATVINLAYPLAPMVHAAALPPQLVQLAAQNAVAGQIQQILQVKQALEQGDKAALLGIVSKVALEKAGQTDLVALTSGGTVGGLVETAVKQKVVQDLTERLGPYQNEVAVLSGLLNFNSALTPQSVKDNNSLTGAPQNYKKVLTMTTTAYGPGYLDNGKWGNLTYVGGTVQKGIVAVDPNVIPMGSKLWIEGYGEGVAADQGSAIKGNHIDLAFNTRQEALDYGIKQAKVYILN